MPPAPLSSDIAGHGLTALRARQGFAGVFDMDGDTVVRQVDLNIGDLPRRLNPQNLSVKLEIMHENGRIFGPVSSLSELVKTIIGPVTREQLEQAIADLQ